GYGVSAPVRAQNHLQSYAPTPSNAPCRLPDKGSETKLATGGNPPSTISEPIAARCRAASHGYQGVAEHQQYQRGGDGDDVAGEQGRGESGYLVGVPERVHVEQGDVRSRPAVGEPG